MIKIFSHRGFIQNNIKQNTIASLKNAVKNNFKAIEIDIWYLNSELYLNHDKPNLNNLKNLTKFRDIFVYKNKLNYWLDFKNLNESNVIEAINLVKKDLLENKIELKNIFFAPYITDYDLAEKISHQIHKIFNEKVNILAVCDESSQIKNVIDLLDLEVFDYVSMNYNLIDDNLLKNLSPKKIFAWTVNDEKIFHELILKGVEQIATDKILPI